MVKSKNIIAGLGVVAGLGMALLPLGAFAETATSDAVEHTVRGTVSDIISIAVSTNKEEELKDGSKISLVDLEPGKLNADLEHTVAVTTNARGGYQLKMNAKDAKNALRYITSYDTTNDDVAATYSDSITIPSVTTDTALADGGNAGWGYKIKKSGGSYTGNFKQIPTAATAIATASSTDVASKTATYTDNYIVNFGILPATDQLSGSYEATLVYQAITQAL